MMPPMVDAVDDTQEKTAFALSCIVRRGETEKDEDRRMDGTVYGVLEWTVRDGEGDGWNVNTVGERTEGSRSTHEYMRMK